MDSPTLFSSVYNLFLSKITDDVFVSLGQFDAYQDMQPMLIASILKFQYPKINIRSFDLDYKDDANLSTGRFNVSLGIDEMDILATYMVLEWLNRQLAHIRLVELAYGGADSKAQNTKNQASTITSISKSIEREVKFKLRNYSNISYEDGVAQHVQPKLSGKNA